MQNAATLLQLRTRVRQAADMVTGQLASFCSDAEVNGYVNDSLGELHDLLVMRFNDAMLRTGYIFQLVGGQEMYPLPNDLQKLADVFYLSGGTRYKLREYMRREVTRYQSSFVMPYGTSVVRYRQLGNSLHFVPMPTTADTVELWYVPQFVRLVNDTDSVEYAVVNSWEEYVVVDAAIKCKDKAELTSDKLMMRKAALVRRIEAAAQDRNTGDPQRVTDVYSDWQWRF